MSRCRLGWGSQGWSATVCASCLLVGHWFLARPGRPVSPGRVDAGAVKGRLQAERALRSAQRPLTAEAARWQPVQQANGRDVRGRRRRSGSPHGSEAWTSFRARNHPVAAVTPSRSATEPLGRSPAMPGPEWIWVLVWIAALVAVLIVVLRVVRRR